MLRTQQDINQVVQITERNAPVDPKRLLEHFRPQPRFETARFSNYVPDVRFPSQALARAKLETLTSIQIKPQFTLFKRKPISTSIYLDGGFGVGKTHLLAATWHAFLGIKFLLSFAELTFTIGALGMKQAVQVFANAQLLCIDEFELDDVGNTLVVSKFLSELIPKGVHVVATSNTLASQLGEGRFNADDFKREIQGIANHFQTIRMDGTDYRHRDGLLVPVLLESTNLQAVCDACSGVRSFEHFDTLLAHLARLHPIRFAGLLDGVDAVFLDGIQPIQKQDDALRFVHFVDKLYDRQVRLSASGCAIHDIFPESYRQGGYAKKYARCMSRLGELLRESAV